MDTSAEFALVVANGIFDESWYLNAYPDVESAGVVPLVHFMETGWREGRSPCALFDLPWYARTYMDDLDLNPAVHYLLHANESGNLPNADWAPGSEVQLLALGLRRTELEAALSLVEIDRSRTPNAPESTGSVRGGELGSRVPAVQGSIPTKAQAFLGRVATALAEARTTAGAVNSPLLDDIPTFSVLMPVYLPRLHHFRAAVDSVLTQSYGSWELVIVDDGSKDESLNEVLNELSKLDPRIKVVSCEDNAGISAATNRALEAAAGEFVALLDQDDLLSRQALFHVSQALGDAVDVLYSDEAVISDSGSLVEIFTKPDWSPYLLLGSMYLGHLCVYRKSLLLDLGGFDSRFDYSQDYDVALRATERARSVVHIEEVLYFWRATPTSAAAGGKDFARESNIAALASALDRRGIEARVLAEPLTNRIAPAAGALVSPASVVIPSDDVQLTRRCVDSVLSSGVPRDLEIIVVVSARSEKIFSVMDWPPQVQIVVDRGLFNFSRKCNVGADACTGDLLVFLNDDVEIMSPDWLAELDFVLNLPGVGAVAPKLLYEDGTIQHAGIVTGVRGHLGTAFHSYRSDEATTLNLAASLREVSVLSGACFAVRRDCFNAVGGFDQVNTPVAHSDSDLSFRIREAGLACLYTPHATLRHFGHTSLATQDPIEKARARHQANEYMWRRFSSLMSRDPYFPPSLRNLTHRDFVDIFEIYLDAGRLPSPDAIRVGIISHDLSLSGAPRGVLSLVRVLVNGGFDVTVVAPLDGPLRTQLVESGACVIIDERTLTEDAFVLDLLGTFRVVIANTVVSVRALVNTHERQSIVAYLQEGEFLNQLLDSDDELRNLLARCDRIWAISNHTAKRVEAFNNSVQILVGCGAPELERLELEKSTGWTANPLSTLKLQVLGSVEPRKGQDLAIEAASMFAQSTGLAVELRINGRTLDPQFLDAIVQIAAQRMRNAKVTVVFGGELSHEEYVQAILKSDIVLVPSRDEPLSLVAVDALAAGKILVTTRSAGVSDFVIDGSSAFIAQTPSPDNLAHALVRAANSRGTLQQMSRKARADYERAFSSERFAKSAMEFVYAASAEETGAKSRLETSS